MSLVVAGVGKSYGGRQVLKDVSFQVEPHEFVCILGHSGCGKSTLLNLIAGFMQPDQGEILVDGVPVRGPDKSRGVVFQDHALFPWYTVLQNVEFGPSVRGLPKREARAQAFRYLKMVGLEAYADDYPHQLSGGMKQRIGIARALANEPDILLMDEPFGALDILTREVMQRELLRIWLELKTMVLFVTHSIGEAVYLADKILVLKNGRVAAEYLLDEPRPRSAAHPRLLELRADIERLLLYEEDPGEGGDLVHETRDSGRRVVPF